MPAVVSVQQRSESIHHDDFAFLCDDIIHDVLQVTHFEHLRESFRSKKAFGGRWGEIAYKFREFKLEDNEIVEYQLDFRSESSAAAANNRKEVYVNNLCLCATTDFNEIEHLVADAYESLRVCCKMVPNEFLNLLGNQFTRIYWNGKENQTNGGMEFLKRQLKSPHLRNLACEDSPVLTRPEFTDLLVDFVSKKNFETLTDYSSSTESIAERVFLAAYEAWLQRKEGEHLLSSIFAPISTEDLHKLTARIPNFSWNKYIQGLETEWSYNEKHPTTHDYEMRLRYDDYLSPSDVKALRMTLSSDGHIKYLR